MSSVDHLVDCRYVWSVRKISNKDLTFDLCNDYTTRSAYQWRIFRMSVEVLGDISVVIFSGYHPANVIVVVTNVESSSFYGTNL